MKNLIAITAIAFSSGAFSADRILFDTYTDHTSRCQSAYSSTCEPWKQPRRVSWQRDLTDQISVDFGAGTNSYGKKSTNAGVLWQPIANEGIKAGLWASYVTGYDCNQLRTCYVVAGGVLTVSIRGFVGQVLYVPAVGSGTVGVINLRTGMEF
jgi:hypothetical protein